VLTTRRVFLCEGARTLAAGAVAGLTGPLLISCVHPNAGTAPAPAPTSSGHAATVGVSGLSADGQSLVAPWPGPDGAPILIVRRSAHQYGALSMQCTHEGCPINPPVEGVMTCPCHGSQFDLAGQVHHGPAQYPLGSYEAVYDTKTKMLTVTFD
jgi:thiosulfate dehydrogenase (quinone) large subunit